MAYDYTSLEYWTEPTSIILAAGVYLTLGAILYSVLVPYQVASVAVARPGPANFQEALPRRTRSRDSIPLPQFAGAMATGSGSVYSIF